MSEKKKSKVPSLEERKLEHQKQLEKQRKIDWLKGSPDMFIEDKSSDVYLDALGLKIKLIGGREISLEECLDANIHEYSPVFPKEYFQHVGRLLEVPKDKMEKYYKPRPVAMFTVQFIYGRFPNKELIKILRKRSPWTIFGVRKYKLFQHLTEAALIELRQYIDDAIAVMRECETLFQFKEVYCSKYPVSFQIELF